MTQPFAVNIIPRMKTALSKWILYLLASLAIGPGLYRLTSAITDEHGGQSAILSDSASPVWMVAACFLAALCASGAFAWIGAKTVDEPTGYILAGICLVWTAWPLANLESLTRLHESELPVYRIALENLACMGIAFVIVWIASRQRLEADSPTTESIGGQKIATAVCIGAIAAAGACYLVANNGLKGQTIAGAVAAGIAAAVVSQFVHGSINARTRPFIPLASLSVVAACGPVVASMLHGVKLEALVTSGDVLPLARPLSLEWPAGGLIGIALGLSWASGAMQRHS
jgi:hypothetical protein